jgi:hypothetical protein
MQHVPFTAACNPTELTVDHPRLKAAARELIQNCVHDGNPEWEKTVDARPFYTVNLTHIPELTGKKEKWTKFSSGYNVTKNFVKEEDFTVTPPEVQASYLGEVMQRIKDRHKAKFGTEFNGRSQLIWVNSKACYTLHRDTHTAHRYHVALWTNDLAWWIFRDKQKKVVTMHMPTDGRVWYLDPIMEEHTVVNLGNANRCHLLMTSVK